jgi:RNA polymerase I-specific transcription initiation factor RRN7
LETYAKKITDDGEGDDSQPEFFSSQPASGREDTETETFRVGSKLVQWPRLIDTVALCYLAALLMRLPVSVMDFHRYVLDAYVGAGLITFYRMVMRNDIPYYRVFLHIPRDMKDKLPQEYIALLETTV